MSKVAAYFPSLVLALALGGTATAAHAQRADDNAVTQADDAFGTTVGNENLGLYNPYDARGFSPIDAGNARIDGLYFDQQADPPNSHISDGSTVRIGISAQGYPLPAPTGIVDYALKRAGDKPIVSLFGQLGPFNDTDIEFDFQTPLGDTLGIAGGATLASSDRTAAKQWSANVGLIPRWTPAKGIEIMPFIDRGWTWDAEAMPLIFTSGAFLPPQIDRRTFYGQDWADAASASGDSGVISRFAFGRATVRVGVFNSFSESKHSFVDLFLNVGRDGVGDHVIIADQNQRFSSTSGEARLSYQLGSAAHSHILHFVVRTRDQQRRYGGGTALNFGRATIGIKTALAEPRPVFGPQTRDSVKQTTLALAYEGQPLRWLALSAGLQKAQYRKTTVEPDAAAPVTGRDNPWLYNVSAAIKLGGKLALYAGYARGLEEGGVAPDSAANKGSAAPAIITRQIDAGIRYAFTPDLKLILGVFNVQKPYYNIDPANIYRRLGDVRHRGIEVSLSGQIAKNLRVVAGTLLLQPRVLGEEVTSGRIGPLPVGKVKRFTVINADYSIARVKGLSVNAGLTSISGQVVNSANTLFIPARVRIDLGARYRFRLGTADASLNFKVVNVSNVFGWRSDASGVFTPNEPRRYSLALTADL